MFRISNHYISRTVVLLISAEVFALMLVVYLGTGLRFFNYAEPFSLSSLFPEAATFAFVMILCMAAMGLYQLDSRLDMKDTLFRLMPSLLAGFGIMTLIFYLVPDLYLGRGILGLVMLLAFSGILLMRAAFLKWSSLRLLESQAIVLGIGGRAREFVDRAKDSSRHRGLKIVGFVPLPDEELQVPAGSVLPRVDSLISLVNRLKVREIIIAIQERRGGCFPIQDLLECKLNGVKVTDSAAFFEREQGKIRVNSLYPSWLIFGGGFDQSPLRTAIKRVFDVVASSILLIITLPVMIVTALCILLEDGRPVFYRQERVGKGGKTFMVVKFRSMRNDAEKGGKPQWALTNDPRVTRVGRIIRKLRIDELPQIFNVLNGDMSFVGPRPERPYFVNQLIAEVPYYNVRHSVKPGITGWAQVRYQYGASVEDAIEKLQYDLYYVKNHSLFLDVIILIETIEVVLLGKGGR
ncbi:TIGR03013 family XrtA/PEP-CTERM system glycosyltransferase [Nitrosospira multiformis]|uniref:Sugar transferase, PEP-CTERM system associated/exopolysaccharide biosynthesis polyprenyl glycosylphosphotransferase n=1 Tax=Nitrosospira multiformis TaxID=1231 RepID=A0A1I7HNL5_9PROT|nr:TIGR03013 family XrtA/PEP-CTERM system glycosyltransferase [Nitrosospira multiformis]SFU62211.1 sugar transferase, PEP-CTERM system associated/exopolysaccharide biosynthesis polyprenyl glycosylphosphotransferase [Nitrosospira multiformis]